MKILLTGSDGQLGLAFQRQNNDHELVCYNRSALNIGNQQEVNKVVSNEQPDAIVNCAAFTNVDGCETQVEEAMHINGTAVGFLSKAAEINNAKLIQISTDYVFDGQKKEPYVESDNPNPLSVYGKSKLLGEELAGDSALIVRTSWVMSCDGKNMLNTVLHLLEGGEDLFFVEDQIGCPTFTDDLASAIYDLIQEKMSGIFNVTNNGVASWHQFATEVARLSGVDTKRIKPIATSELIPQRPARRPANSVLGNKKLLDYGFSPLPTYTKTLSSIIQKH